MNLSLNSSEARLAALDEVLTRMSLDAGAGHRVLLLGGVNHICSAVLSLPMHVEFNQLALSVLSTLTALPVFPESRIGEVCDTAIKSMRALPEMQDVQQQALVLLDSISKRFQSAVVYLSERFALDCISAALDKSMECVNVRISACSLVAAIATVPKGANFMRTMGWLRRFQILIELSAAAGEAITLQNILRLLELLPLMDVPTFKSVVPSVVVALQAPCLTPEGARSGFEFLLEHILKSSEEVRTEIRIAIGACSGGEATLSLMVRTAFLVELCGFACSTFSLFVLHIFAYAVLLLDGLHGCAGT